MGRKGHCALFRKKHRSNERALFQTLCLIDSSDLPNCMFGFCLRRILHYIVGVRIRHPSTRILIAKYDVGSAYRRAHLSAETAVESMTMFNGLLLIALQMTFGSAACPS